MIQLNHIGIAVADLPQMRKLFRILGTSVAKTEDVTDQGVRTHFLPMSFPEGGAALELLEPTDPQGTIAQFLAKRGPGIHHLSFLVVKGALAPLCVELKAQGFRLVYDAPRLGAHQMKINFVHPATAGGLLIEIMEPS